MLNGRGEQNDFTCISHKGKSVVDYIITPYENISLYKNFTVMPISNIINDFNIPILPNMQSKLDHSILQCYFDVSPWIGNNPQCPTEAAIQNVKRYKIEQIPRDFMQNKWAAEVLECINRIENKLATENDITGAYNKFGQGRSR